MYNAGILISFFTGIGKLGDKRYVAIMSLAMRSSRLVGELVRYAEHRAEEGPRLSSRDDRGLPPLLGEDLRVAKAAFEKTEI